VTWSRHWDELVAEDARRGRSDVLRTGREVEVGTLQLVLFPDRIQAVWEAGEFGRLGYLAEALATWPEDDLESTDPARFRNVSKGLAKARQAGWQDRLDTRRLHDLEAVLQGVLDSQRAEGLELSAAEVLEVRRRLAEEHLEKGHVSTRGQKQAT
jgi:hypothetical protein